MSVCPPTFWHLATPLFTVIWRRLIVEGRKEMFYLTTHSAHFIYGYNGVRHMVKDHSDSERGNPLPPHGLLFPISSKGSLYASSHRQDNTYHDLCYTSRGALAGTRNSSNRFTMKDRSDDHSHHERTLLPRSYISLFIYIYS